MVRLSGLGHGVARTLLIAHTARTVTRRNPHLMRSMTSLFAALSKEIK
jgi:hypothetical protein